MSIHRQGPTALKTWPAGIDNKAVFTFGGYDSAAKVRWHLASCLGTPTLIHHNPRNGDSTASPPIIFPIHRMSSRVINQRVNFASVKNPMPYPDFLDVQLKSFKDFLQLGSLVLRLRQVNISLIVIVMIGLILICMNACIEKQSLRIWT